MSENVKFVQGNEACAEAALYAGLDFYAGYPITPSSEITEYLAYRFGSSRKLADRTCAREARQLLGIRSQQRWSEGEKLAWRRWSPLILILPGVARWSEADKKALVAVVRAKGGLRESDFALQFDRHRKLRRAVSKMALAGD